MTRTLGQVVGVMMRIRTRDGDEGKVLQKRVQSEPQVTGTSKVFVPKNEGTPEETAVLRGKHPDKYKPVALTVPDVLREAAQYAIPAIDVTATNDATNQTANADLIVGGEIMIKNVPVSHLLWLKNYLGEWRKFISVLPTLDPTKKWSKSDDNGNIYESDPEITAVNDKDLVPIVLHEGNERYAPQVQLVQRDMIYVGQYFSKSLSGEIFESRKKELLDHVEVLIGAVEDATVRANHAPAIEISHGGKIMGFLLA